MTNKKMTNKELIDILQESLDKYGEIPVTMDCYVDEYERNNTSIKDVKCYHDEVVIYNY